MLVVLGEDALSVMEEDINQGGEGGGDGATYREEAPVVWWTTCRDLHAGADWICYGGGRSGARQGAARLGQRKGDEAHSQG